MQILTGGQKKLKAAGAAVRSYLYEGKGGRNGRKSAQLGGRMQAAAGGCVRMDLTGSPGTTVAQRKARRALTAMAAKCLAARGAPCRVRGQACRAASQEHSPEGPRFRAATGVAGSWKHQESKNDIEEGEKKKKA